MKKVNFLVNGEVKECRMFRTKDAAVRYIEKHNVEMIYFRAHEYIVG